MMITLFHGTTQEIQHPLAHVGRADLDFGQGFYLTSIRSQAERWAQRVQLLRSADDARLNVSIRPTLYNSSSIISLFL